MFIEFILIIFILIVLPISIIYFGIQEEHSYRDRKAFRHLEL
jgi:hypothetical protein